MKLSAWMQQSHNRLEELQMVCAVARAVNAEHARNHFMGSLDPEQIDLDGNACRLGSGSSNNPLYIAPERSATEPPNQKNDVYSAGVILYEALAKQHPVDTGTGTPTPLRDLRKDLDSDLADAVSACVEKDPEWRPGDLSYVEEVAKRLYEAAGGSVSAPAPRPAPPPAAPRPTVSAMPSITSPAPAPTGGGSKLPMILGGLVAVAAIAGGGWYFMAGPGAAPAQAPPATSAPPATAAPAQAGDDEAAPDTGEDPLDPLAAGAAEPEAGTAAAAPTTTTATAPTAPTTTASTTAPPATRAPAPTTTAPPTPPPTTAPPATTQPPATTVPPTTAAPAPAGPPPRLATISPAKVRRGSPAVIDVHGANLRDDQTASVTDAKTGAPVAGVRVMGKRLARADLMQVSVRIGDDAKPGKYNFILVDAAGQTSNAVLLEID